MKINRKRILAIVLTGLMALSILGGCTAARKPLPNDTRTPPAPAPAPTTPQGAEARDAADDIAKNVEKVPGVERSYVVVVGNVSLIGLDIDKDKQEEGTNSIKAEVVRRAEDDRRIVRAYVSTDADTVSRIREIADGIRNGRPVTEFLDEISEIIDRIAPTGDRRPNVPGR